MAHKDVKIIEDEYAYQGFFSIKHYRLRHKLFSGEWSNEISRELVIRPDAAGALLYDPVLDKVVLLEQFRVGPLNSTLKDHPWFTEIVAGLIDKDESPEEVIRREIQEEAGLIALDLWPICHYWASPGGSSENIFLYCAKVDAKNAGGIFGLKEEDEDIRVFTLDTQTAFAMVSRGEINNAMALIGLLWLQVNVEAVRKKWL